MSPMTATMSAPVRTTHGVRSGRRDRIIQLASDHEWSSVPDKVNLHAISASLVLTVKRLEDLNCPPIASPMSIAPITSISAAYRVAFAVIQS